MEVAVAHADLALSGPPVKYIYVRGEGVEEGGIMFKVEETTGAPAFFFFCYSSQNAGQAHLFRR